MQNATDDMSEKYETPIFPNEGIVSEPKYDLYTNGDNLGKSFRYADQTSLWEPYKTLNVEGFSERRAESPTSP